MAQSVGSQRVGHDLGTEQEQEWIRLCASSAGDESLMSGWGRSHVPNGTVEDSIWASLLAWR